MEHSNPNPKARIKLRLRTKLAFGFAFLATLFVGVVIFTFYQNMRAQLRQDVRDRLRDAVAIAALQVDGDQHALLTDPSQEGGELYMQLKRVLQNIRDAGAEYRFVYTMRQNSDGSILFVVDAEESEEDISHLGDIYVDAGPMLVENFATMQQPMVEEDFYTDKWGTWLTGYAPFYASDGRREGILGMDISSTKVIEWERRAMWLALVIFLVSTPPIAALGWLLGNSLTRPISKLIEGTEAITLGDLDRRVNVKTGDEIEVLAEAFNVMAGKTSALISGLEQSVAERTALLSTVNQLGHAISSVLDPEEVIHQAVNLITERLGYYYAAIFLVDASGQWAELKDATGEAGRVLRESKHRLQVEGRNMVGTAIRTRRARVALDVGAESVRFENPLLPYTRSEIALPLLVGDRVLGALDVQSTAEAAFSEQDIETMQGMANQVAVTLENARLFQDTRHSLQELSAIQRQYVREGWESLTASTDKLGYEVGEKYADAGGAELDVPLTLRDQIIGQITIEGEDEWTQEERAWVDAVATQAAIALENARLVEQSQKSAAYERIVSEITGKVWSASSIDAILRTAVRELGRALNASEARIELGIDEDGERP
ncbi:MAG: GAF domain-containing protein [Chloroflexota bacterium]